MQGDVSLCPALDTASQGDTIEEARTNLQDALELFFETASPEETKERLHWDVYVTRVDVALGKLRILPGKEVRAILARHRFVEARLHGSHIINPHILPRSRIFEGRHRASCADRVAGDA